MRGIRKLFFIILSVISLSWIVSGCIYLTGHLKPLRIFQETIKIDANISNRELTERLLVILAGHKIAPCSSVPNLQQTKEDCVAELWQGNLTHVDAKSAVIEIGDFSSVTAVVIGHSARINRAKIDEIVVSIKGVGAYYHELPNAEVAKKVAITIHQNL